MLPCLVRSISVLVSKRNLGYQCCFLGPHRLYHAARPRRPHSQGRGVWQDKGTASFGDDPKKWWKKKPPRDWSKLDEELNGKMQPNQSAMPETGSHKIWRSLGAPRGVWQDKGTASFGDDPKSRWEKKPPKIASRKDVLSTLILSTDYTEAKCDALLRQLPEFKKHVDGSDTPGKVDLTSLYTQFREAVRLLHKRGIKPRAMRRVLEACYPDFLEPPGQLDQTVEFLSSMRLRDRWLHRAAMRCPELLRIPATQLGEVSSALRGYKVRGDQLFKILRREPEVYARPVSELYSQIRMLRQAGFHAYHLPQILAQCPRFLLLPPKVIQMGVDGLRSLGLSDDDMRQLLNKAPPVLRYLPSTLQLKWQYYTTELGLTKQDIIKHAKVLICASIAEKIGPRHRLLLKFKGTAPSIEELLLRHSDSVFCKSHGIPSQEYAVFKDEWLNANGQKWVNEDAPEFTSEIAQSEGTPNEAVDCDQYDAEDNEQYDLIRGERKKKKMGKLKSKGH